MIPIMSVGNGYQVEMHGLGKNVPLCDLSEKRITKAVREKLRSEYGHDNVTVSCSADFTNGVWTGTCSINEKSYQYEIHE
jgi:hypothetical protein